MEALERQNLASIIQNLDEVRLNRRALLKRAGALGLGSAAMLSLLAACEDDDDDDEVEATDDSDEVAEEPAVEDEDDEVEEVDEPDDDGEEPDEEVDEEDEEEEEDDGEAPAETDEEPIDGGKLIIANISQSPTNDIHVASTRGLNMSMWHVFESLFTWDADWGLAHMLVDTYDASDDALSHTIAIRQGVPFHNGDELTSADVVASLDRWSTLSPLGELLYGSVDDIVATDDYTIEITLTSPLATVPHLLARGGQGAAIYPQSVVEAAGQDFVDEYIGTGPYQFTEMQADRYLLLTRFDDYASRDEEPSGYSGRKVAHIEELEFLPITDEAARTAGFQAGDYHYVEEIIADQIEQLEGDPNFIVEQLPIRSHGYIGLNHREGLMTDLTLRKAVQAAMDVYPQGLASHGEGFFDLGPGIMLPTTVWDSDAGAEYYDMNDPDLARELLEEAGYDGTPIRWITTQEDFGDYQTALVCQQQLEEVGFNVELIIFDEATLFTERSTPEGWDIWNGAFILRTDPTLLPYLSSCEYSGWWCSDEKEEAFERLSTEIEFEDRYAAFEDLQRLFHEEVGGIKQQDNYGIMVASASMRNFGAHTTHFELEPEFTNSWIDESVLS